MENYAYLGVGLKYPVVLVSGRGVLTSQLDLIEQSILIILETPIGSRLFLREFGSRIPQLLFEPDDEVVNGMMGMFISEALGQWEKRISVIEEDIVCDFDPDNGAVFVTVPYTVLSSNEIKSYIYPFYRQLDY